MYNITSEALDLFKNSYRQVVDIIFAGVAETIHLTEKDITLGGLAINRYCVSGSKIEIGSAIAGELTIILDNSDGRFNQTLFEGAELFVRVGTKKWDAKRWENADYHYIPMGYFTIDEAPRKLEQIKLSALDRMVLFDKSVDKALLTFPMTVSNLLNRICDLCNVELGINSSTLLNATYVINSCPEDDGLTYRQLLCWIAEITGTCAFIDWDGKLILKWYEDTSTLITKSDRQDSDLSENLVSITGVQVKDGDNIYLSGEDDYILNIEDNALIQHDYRDIADVLCEAIQGFAYLPYTASIKPMPHLYPLDIIIFVDKYDVRHQTIITDYTFSLNKNTEIAGKGETETNNGYASSNPLTKKESAIINSIKNEANKTLNDRVQTVLAFNELISNALGLFVTPNTMPDGSTIYYMHNSSHLEESMLIFTMTDKGIAWTNTGWNDGNPDWSYGVTDAGDALFRKLSAEGIEVSKVGEDYNIEITPSAFRIYYRDMLVTNIERDEETIPKAHFSTYAEVGKTRWVPYNKDGELEGTNLVIVD